MKDLRVLYVYTTDDPSDPVASPTGIAPLIANEQGALWTEIVGGGGGGVGIPVNVGAMGSPIVTDGGVNQQYGLDTRSLLYGLESTGSSAQPVNVTQLGAVTIDPGSFGGAGALALACNAFMYGYDLDISDGSQTGVNVWTPTPTTDGIAGTMMTTAQLYAWNGATYERITTGSAANLAAAQVPGPLLATDPGEWSVTHTPAANTQATISRAAGAAGVRHVCKSITVSGIGLAAAAEASVLVNLRDGATGAGTILWSQRIYIPAGGQNGFSIAGLNIVGSAATAMTLEFAAAGGANTFESVAMTGYDAI